MRKLIGVLSALLLCSTLFAQTHTVTGQVLDEAGKHVSFGSVKVKGSKAGVAAGQDGRFSIHAATGGKLIISATAFDAIEIAVPASGEVSAVLKAKSGALEDVVVTAFGVRRQAKELGYATA